MTMGPEARRASPSARARLARALHGPPGNAVRRRRSLSRILSSRPTGGSSSHSSGPPVARGIERPTRGNGRATRARPRGRTSLLLGLAPGGVYRASALTDGSGELLPRRFTLAPGPKARGGLLSVALSPDRSGPPLAATLPCGVRTFLPSPARRAAARPPPADARRRRARRAGSPAPIRSPLPPPRASITCAGSSGRAPPARGCAGSR